MSSVVGNGARLDWLLVCGTPLVDPERVMAAIVYHASFTTVARRMQATALRELGLIRVQCKR